MPNYGREVDAALGWSGPFKGVTLNFSGTYLNVSPLHTMPRGDVFQFSEKVSRKIPFGRRESIRPYLWFRESVPVRGSTPVGGWYAHEGVTFSNSFGKNLSNDTTFEIVRDSGAAGYKTGVIGRFLETFSWKQGKHTSLQIPIVVTEPLSHTGDGRKLRVTGGLTLSLSY